MADLAGDRTVSGRRIHWHVILIHFPISFFVVAFGFQVLHLFLAPACFELSTNMALAAGTIMMVPTTWSGWRSWKNRYNGALTKLFRRKITTAFVMISLSIVLSAWRFFALGIFEEAPMNPEHWIYLAGNIVLVLGATIEGFYGGRLNHR